VPDSHLERAWRKLRGKKKTKIEEREAREEKKRMKMASMTKGPEGEEQGTPEIYVGFRNGKGDDGVIR